MIGGAMIVGVGLLLMNSFQINCSTLSPPEEAAVVTVGVGSWDGAPLLSSEGEDGNSSKGKKPSSILGAIGKRFSLFGGSVQGHGVCGGFRMPPSTTCSRRARSGESKGGVGPGWMAVPSALPFVVLVLSALAPPHITTLPLTLPPVTVTSRWSVA